MGLRINTNVSSLQAQNSLAKTSKDLNQSLTRLSTGLRINTGKDDVVGLAKSEILKAKIRGVDVALNNISNATSVLGVAEGFMSQLTDIAQQMRETAVQAADGTISTSDRTSLQDKFTSLMNEYNRLAVGANFNGVSLLDGTFTSKSLQVGSDEGNTISISIADARSSTVGKVAIFTSVVFTSVSSNSTASTVFTDPGAGLAFTVGSTSVTVNSSNYTSDGVSYMEASESAIAYVNAINQVSGQTGITATVLANVFTLNYSMGTGLGSHMALIINGVTCKSSALNVSLADDTDASTLVGLINDVATQTGVTATIDTANNKIILTASDGRNIHLQTNANDATNASSSNVFGMTGSATCGQVNVRGTFKLQRSTAFSITDGTTGNQVAGASSSAVAVSSTYALKNANLNTATNSATAISILDNVISQLQTRRATIGSTANRLEIAKTELQSRTENLSASLSLIRDVDVASETAKMTQSQILQQAGATMLAQANSAPQIALQLLQNL